jgi:hypothetical protein
MASPYTPNVAISSASSLLLTESPTFAPALIAPSNGLPNSRLSIVIGSASTLEVPIAPPPVLNSPTPASPIADWLNGPTNSEAFVWPIGNSALSPMEQLIGSAPIGPQLTMDEIIGSSAPIGPQLTMDEIVSLTATQPSLPLDLAANDQTAQMIEAITGPQIPDADRALIADTIDYPSAEGTSQLSPELLAVINGMAPEPIAQPSPPIQPLLPAEEAVYIIPLPNATLGSQGTLLPPPELLKPDFQPAPMPVLTELPISSLLVTTSFPEPDSELTDLDLAGLPIGVVPGAEALALDGQLGF